MIDHQRTFEFAKEPEWEPAKLPDQIGSSAVEYIDSSQILTKATGFMSAYDYTLNPYHGCTFACTYCYAAAFSPDEDMKQNWGKWVRAKQNAIDILKRPKQRAKLNGARIFMSSATDAYQPLERTLKLTRGLLEIMADGHTPTLVVQTRSPDVIRDLDLFHKINENGGHVRVNMTVTTDSELLRKIYEPQCPSVWRRLDAIKQVQDDNIKSCVTITPFLWADDMPKFVDAILNTGTRRILMSPFKFTSGSFVSTTRDSAYQLIADMLGCQLDRIEPEYMKHYNSAKQLLLDKIDSNKIEFHERKYGFSLS